LCGICGIVNLDGAPAVAGSLAPALRLLGHRGPDGSCAVASGPAALGHTRLSILDLEGGAQPMAGADDTLLLSFNGEIFNYLELRQDLIERGHVFVTRSDTEVILHAYAVFGEDCVNYFNGQWAFALWDARRRKLFLSRDRLGVRPMFWTRTATRFLFASEVKALFLDPDVRRRLDPRGMAQLFTFWATLAPRTVFDGIQELPPGHSLTLEAGRLRTWAYWRPDFTPDPCPQDERRQAEVLGELLLDATRLRLRADVPVAAYLSGGLDSSLTTALVRQVAAAPPATFSVVFDDPEYDERAYQQEVSAFLGTAHRAVPCAPADIGACFPDVVWHAERPVLRTAAAPLFLLSRLVRQSGFKVVVTGEGADEVLAGYDVFREARLRRLEADSPGSRRAALLYRRLYPYQGKFQAQSDAYLQAFFKVRDEDRASPFFSHLPRWRLTRGLWLFFAPEVQAELGDYDPIDDFKSLLPADYARWGELAQAQYLEMACLLPGYILSAQGDRVAMAHGVEGRFPFLDHRVVEFAGRLRPGLKLRGMREKYLLKRVAAGLVPDSVIRRPKQPYRAPDAASFFGSPERPLRFDYVEELLGEGRLRAAGIFNPAAAGKLVQKARAGQVAGVRDNMALVGVLSTQLVVERFIDRFGVAGLHA
jgi:asparagine synthase (glutamine-hydrolysing)